MAESGDEQGSKGDAVGRRRGERGSLLATLFVVSFIIIVAFSMAGMAFHHWGFSQTSHNRQVARNLADSLAVLASARIIATPSFGADPSVVADTLPLTDPDNPGARAWVTFSTAKATELKIPLSRNNQTDASIDGLDLRIPRRTAQIITHAECNGVICETEMVLHVPPFPLALVASGPLVSTGGLQVTAVRNARDYTGASAVIPPAKRAMATVASNSTMPQAIDLGSGAVINGNVQAVGGIHIAPGGLVKGAVMPDSAPAPIPDLDMTRAIATCVATRSAAFNLPATTTDLEVEWLYRCYNNLTVNGSVTLNGGTLYVQGDLHVTGCVQGNGCIIVGGRTTIDRGADLNADNVVALMSRGLVTLTGTDRASSYIQGVVYSETGVRASHLTVLGTLITRDTVGDGSVSLEDVGIVCAPVTVQTRAGLPWMSGVDDDETWYSAYAYPNPADGGRTLLYSATAIPFKDDAEPDLSWKRTWTGVTRTQAIANILALDDAAPHPGGVGHTITNHGGLDELNAYFDDLEAGPVAGHNLLNFDLNRLLKPAVQSRVLLWRQR